MLQGVQTIITEQSPTPLCQRGVHHRLQVGSFLLHCADLSNATKPFRIAQRWTELIMMEFFEQGETEKRLSLPVSPNCDAETTCVPKLQVSRAFSFSRPPLGAFFSSSSGRLTLAWHDTCACYVWFSDPVHLLRHPPDVCAPRTAAPRLSRRSRACKAQHASVGRDHRSHRTAPAGYFDRFDWRSAKRRQRLLSLFPDSQTH